MATLNAVIVPAKALRDGKHKVRISVAHNGETRYIVTNIKLDSAKEFKNGAVVKRPDAAYLNTKLRGILQKYQEAIDYIDYINGLTCPELVFLLKNGSNDRHRTLQSVYEEYASNSSRKQSTIETNQYKWNVITKYVDRNMLVEGVSRATLLNLNTCLRKRGIANGTMSNILSYFMCVVRYAVKCGYVQFRADPFIGFKLPEKQVRQSWLSVDEIKRIRDLETPKDNISRCRDLFMLSYYLGGINLADLTKIDFNKYTKTIRYVRKKTEDRSKVNKFVEFDMPEEALEIIDRYKEKKGFMGESRNMIAAQSFFAYNMPLLAKEVGIEKLIYYSARKSFAQHAFNLGISTGIIDYILGHKLDKGGTSLYAYISVTPEMATKAIRQVLDNLK